MLHFGPIHPLSSTGPKQSESEGTCVSQRSIGTFRCEISFCLPNSSSWNRRKSQCSSLLITWWYTCFSNEDHVVRLLARRPTVPGQEAGLLLRGWMKPERIAGWVEFQRGWPRFTDGRLEGRTEGRISNVFFGPADPSPGSDRGPIPSSRRAEPQTGLCARGASAGVGENSDMTRSTLPQEVDCRRGVVREYLVSSFWLTQNPSRARAGTRGQGETAMFIRSRCKRPWLYEPCRSAFMK